MALLCTLIYTAKERRALVQDRVTSTPTAARAGSNSAAASSGWRTRASRNETLQERRKRMISNEDDHEDFKLSEQEVYMFVQAKGSNAVSLVAAFESSRDREYLKAAFEKFPNDPFVQAKALLWLDLPERGTRQTR